LQRRESQAPVCATRFTEVDAEVKAYLRQKDKARAHKADSIDMITYRNIHAASSNGEAQRRQSVMMVWCGVKREARD
jgi:hypothetical protein